MSSAGSSMSSWSTGSAGSTAEGSAAGDSSFEAVRERASQRLCFLEPRGGWAEHWQAPKQAAPLVARKHSEALALALAYYRVTWRRFLSPSSSRSKPHAFPWSVAGDFMLEAVTGKKAV